MCPFLRLLCFKEETPHIVPSRLKSPQRKRPSANNRLILEYWHMTFPKCKTAFIKPRLGRTESLIQLQLACHNILTALSSANLFSHRECYWRLRAPVNCRIPGDRPRGSANLNVSNLWCAQLLLRCLFLSKREHFKLARQNRWLQQIWASSWASHAISFKLPSLATVRIILSHPILYVQMSSCFTKQSQTLGWTFCCVYGRVVCCFWTVSLRSHTWICMSALLVPTWLMINACSSQLRFTKHALQSQGFVFTYPFGISSSGGEQTVVWLPQIFLPSARGLAGRQACKTQRSRVRKHAAPLIQDLNKQHK